MAPPVSPRTAAFWTGGGRGQLVIDRCDECGTYLHPPRPICPACRSAAITPHAVSGRGRVRSFTINRYQWVATMPPPYVVVEVELFEQPGLILLSNLVGPASSDVAIGLVVEARFVHTGDAFIPVFVVSDP